jgi:glycogen debranching enzyme
MPSSTLKSDLLERLTPDFNRNIEIDIEIPHAGPFSYYITYTPLPKLTTGKSDVPKPTQTKVWYLDVSPRLEVQGSTLPLKSLSIISCLSKSMGKYPSDWDKHLHGISERGYNMVHFTPLMMRGDSNSPYSIYDQHTFDKQVFVNGEKDIETLTTKMQKDFGLLSLTDVVWNHTANNSKWLEEHPEAGYNMKTAPWLQGAYELDTQLLKFGSELESHGLPTHINNNEDLLKVMAGVPTHVIDAIKFWEFYVINVKHDAQTTVTAWMENQVQYPEKTPDLLGTDSWSLQQKTDWFRQYALIGTDRLGGRFSRKINPQYAAAFLQSLFGKYNTKTGSTADERNAMDTISHLLDSINASLYDEYNADVAIIKEQVFNRTKYMRLEGGGHQGKPVSPECPLIESYFTRLPSNETTKKHETGELALANNGWVWAADVLKDNAGPHSQRAHPLE